MFQRLMERCLGGFNSDTVLVCLDDIIIFSKTCEDRVKTMDRVLVKNTKSKRGSKIGS